MQDRPVRAEALPEAEISPIGTNLVEETLPAIGTSPLEDSPGTDTPQGTESGPMRTGDIPQGTGISNGLIPGPGPRKVGTRDPSPEDRTLGPTGTGPMRTGPIPGTAPSPIEGLKADLLLGAMKGPPTLMRVDPAGPLTQGAGPAGQAPKRSGPSTKGWTGESTADQIMILAEKRVAQSAPLPGTMSLSVTPTTGTPQKSALPAKRVTILQTNAWKWKDSPLILGMEGPWN